MVCRGDSLERLCPAKEGRVEKKKKKKKKKKKECCEWKWKRVGEMNMMTWEKEWMEKWVERISMEV